MTSPKSLVAALFAVGLTCAGSAQAQEHFRSTNEFWGSRYQPAPVTAAPTQSHPSFDGAAGRIRHWNEIAINSSGLDHTPVAPGENRVFGEQVGPARSSRAIAIVQIAVFDAVNAFDRNYDSYSKIHPAHPRASMEAAIAQAAHDTLNALFPSQQAACDQALANDLSQIANTRPLADGVAVGREAAAAILAARANDGSQRAELRVGIDFITSNDAGKWRQDPISHHPLALGAFWGQVRPFVLRSTRQFRTPSPPPLNSAEYATAYNEVKSMGGDGITTPTTRTPEQTQIGIYWAYDGTPSLCAPPRLYNQITMNIADRMGTSSNPVELARLMALVNVAMADACMCIWESKYFYQFWRPITGIRESDLGTGPSGAGDGNAATAGDPNFSPLGAPASNLNGPNFTPPFPAYPSGHAGFGGALFQTLRNFYRTDRIDFTFVSDEFNGVTHDNAGNVRPLTPRSFSSLSQAEEENGQSRIYLGIHWKFDKTAGIAQGRRVADYVFANAFAPRGKGKSRDD